MGSTLDCYCQQTPSSCSLIIFQLSYSIRQKRYWSLTGRAGLVYTFKYWRHFENLSRFQANNDSIQTRVKFVPRVFHPFEETLETTFMLVYVHVIREQHRRLLAAKPYSD